jgi:hypothetical protein
MRKRIAVQLIPNSIQPARLDVVVSAEGWWFGWSNRLFVYRKRLIETLGREFVFNASGVATQVFCRIVAAEALKRREIARQFGSGALRNCFFRLTCAV